MLKADPKRANERNEMLLPKLVKSRTLNPLPHRTNERRDKEELSVT
jgi:hypothetical protein